MKISSEYSINRVKRLMAASQKHPMTRRTATVYMECRKWLGTW